MPSGNTSTGRDAPIDEDMPMKYEKPAAARTKVVGLMTVISGVYIPCDSDLAIVPCDN